MGRAMPPDAATPTPADHDSWATLKRFLPYLWPRENPVLRRRIVTAVLLVLLAKATTLTLPYAYKYAVDAMSTPGNEAAMVALAAIMVVLPQTQVYVERFVEGIQGQDLATQMRFGEYKDAFNLISRYPLTGVGFFGTPDIDVYVGVSSVYLLLAQQLGLVGAGLYILIGLVYLLIVFTTVNRLPQNHPLETPLLAYGAAILGAMVGGVFDHFYFNLTFIHIAAFYWLIMGLGMVAVLLRRQELDPNFKSDDRFSARY